MTSKFFLLIGGIVIVVLVGTLYYLSATTGKTKTVSTNTSTTAKSMAVVSLAPATGNYKVNEIFDVAITLNTKSQTVGTQAYLTYDPTKLEVQDQDLTKDGVQITAGTLYGTVMTNTVKDGKISFAAVAAGNQKTFSGKGTLATVKFKALAATTEPTPVALTFVPGSTGETTLVGMDAKNLNIVSEVKNAVYNIE